VTEYEQIKGAGLVLIYAENITSSFVAFKQRLGNNAKNFFPPYSSVHPILLDFRSIIIFGEQYKL
jgi:hypothetical protein